ncbi:MAG: alpha/beta fold hydrolase [Dehalococcoidales bacterium]|nr:alpha/beta fold hydrolase [Dehalococcoidales bacterium]
MASLPNDKYIKVGTVNTRYCQAGNQGSKVILIHGFPASLDIWQKNFMALSQRHQVYALDWLGSGRTDKLPLVTDLNALTEFISDFMKALNIDKASLIGSSMGGGLALQMAITHPQKVGKLILLDNAGMGPQVTSFYHLVSIPWLGRLLLSNSTPQNTRIIFESVIYDHSLITSDLINLTCELGRLPGALDATLSIAHAGASIMGQRAKYWKPVRKALGDIKVPTLIVWGKQDKIVPVKHAKIAARIPGSKVHIFDKCGHIPMFERPEEFNKITLDFLAE